MMSCDCHVIYRLTGYSPFQGETHNDTFYNVSICEYDFEDEVFDIVSQDAKDFIEELLQKRPKYELKLFVLSNTLNIVIIEFI